MSRLRLAPCFAALLLTSLAAPAHAVQTPKPGTTDPRVRTIDYDPAQVVAITGVYRTATQILFGEAETILHVALGDATAWDVAVEKNILFIKPKAAHGATNLIVTTSLAGGGTRNYTFDLTTTARRTSGALFVLRFRYPADVTAAATAAISAQEQAIQARITTLKLERGAVEGPRNLSYEVQGAPALQPSEVSDNGRFTILRFPAGQPIPAIYAVSGDGTETRTPFDVRGEFVVVHAVARQVRLRRGRQVLCIYNTSKTAWGVNLGTNTASPQIERTDLAAPSSSDRHGQAPQ